MINYLVVIPARLGSKRLPNKPLLNIKGIPMIIRTFNQCKKVVPLNKIIIATDSKKIVDVCKKYNAPVTLTSKHCLTGTDRVVEVAKKIKSKIYVNLQGDEPVFPEKDLKLFISKAIKNKKILLNGYCDIKNFEDFKSLSIPKVVIDEKENLLYMSRSAIPGNKKNRFIKAWRQVCVYSFPREILLKITKNNKKSKLENIEDIEILRFIEKGMSVKMIKLSNKSLAVDTKKDLKKVLKLIN